MGCLKRLSCGITFFTVILLRNNYKRSFIDKYSPYPSRSSCILCIFKEQNLHMNLTCETSRYSLNQFHHMLSSWRTVRYHLQRCCHRHILNGKLNSLFFFSNILTSPTNKQYDKPPHLWNIATRIRILWGHVKKRLATNTIIIWACKRLE